MYYLACATHCNKLQHTATHCSTLQNTATHRNTPQQTALTLLACIQVHYLMGISEGKCGRKFSNACMQESCHPNKSVLAHVGSSHGGPSWVMTLHTLVPTRTHVQTCAQRRRHALTQRQTDRDRQTHIRTYAQIYTEPDTDRQTDTHKANIHVCVEPVRPSRKKRPLRTTLLVRVSLRVCSWMLVDAREVQ